MGLAASRFSKGEWRRKEERKEGKSYNELSLLPSQIHLYLRRVLKEDSTALFFGCREVPRVQVVPNYSV